MPLTPQHTATLYAAADRIVPPDDGTPGAIASGAAARLVEMLDGDLGALQADYVAFLSQLDREASSAHGRHFCDLDPGQQDAALRKIEAAPFFLQFAEHVHEQYWSSPAGLAHAGFEVRG
jgi:hypothetical protein